MFAKKIRELAVRENTLALVWLGQAGFLIKTPGGKIIAIDPYLSDYVYDFETGCVKPACLYEGWQTSGSKKIVRMAFNLYCNGTPSVDEDTTTDEQLYECRQYSVEELFCCEYALYFWQAVQIRYPEYTSCNRKLSELTGG